MKRLTYVIVNDRIYCTHFPRKIKELKLELSCPKYDNPSKMIMQSIVLLCVCNCVLAWKKTYLPPKSGNS